MKQGVRQLTARFSVLLLLVSCLLVPRQAGAYSVLSHEEVVDMAWKDTIIPMLKVPIPGISDDEIRTAHAYAYGGSVIQDIGYYPFGSHYFSDLLHYVRPDQFVNALILDSTTPNEYAFALGALAHFCGDIIGHPAINKLTSDENPPLQTRFGQIVTYAEDPTAHIRTEFGFDVAEVAHGHYSQENYRDFVGFQVSKKLLERAFQETYGIPVTDVLKHEDLAIATYRRAVSVLIPKMTKVAFASYKDQIEQAAPGTAKNKFLYRLDQTEYNKEFGTDYTHLTFKGQVLADILRFLPKVGPLKALKVTIPNPKEQTVYLKSINDTVDRYKLYLHEIHAEPAPLPPPDPKDAVEARKAAEKIDKDAAKVTKLAEKAQDPEDKAAKEKVAENVQKVAAEAGASADRTEAKVATAQAALEAGVAPPQASGAVASTHPIEPPSVPQLPELDLDTGKPSAAGEYTLADQTYGKLLDELLHAPGPGAPRTDAAIPASIKPMENAMVAGGATPPLSVDPLVAAAIEQFFANPYLGPARPHQQKKLRATRRSPTR